MEPWPLADHALYFAVAAIAHKLNPINLKILWLWMMISSGFLLLAAVVYNTAWLVMNWHEIF